MEKTGQIVKKGFLWYTVHMGSRLIIAAAAGIMLTFLPGCRKHEQPEKIQLTLVHGWNGSSQDHRVMRDIYSSFEDRYPGVQLRTEVLPDISIVIEKATAMLAVDRVPDIISTNGWSRYADNAVLKKTALNLTPFIKNDPEFMSFLPHEITVKIERDEPLYTIPDTMEMQGIWYNADILYKAGIVHTAKNPAFLCRTWDEFIDICKSVNRYVQDGGNGYIPFVIQNEQYLSLLGAIIGGSRRTASPPAFAQNPEHSLFFDKTAIAEGLLLLKTITSYGKVSTGTASLKDARESFVRGESAFFFNGVWDSIVLNDSPAAPAVHHVPYPSETGKTVAYRFLPSGYVIGNRAGTDMIQYSVAFLKYMLSPEVQQRIVHETMQIPINPGIDIYVAQNSNRLFSEAYANIKKADTPIESMHRIWSQSAISYFLTHINDFIQEKIGAEDMADRILEHL